MNRLIAQARAWLPPGVALGACSVAKADPLLPQEAACMARATPARRAEFAAGRTAARRAMTVLGQAGAIPMRADRSPAWPEGLCGSITHAGGQALALVADARRFRALGIDVERQVALEQSLISTICTPDDLACAMARTGEQAALAALRVFSAKECAYKAQYRHSGQLFGFERFAVTIGADGAFSARFTAASPPFRQDDSLDGMQVAVDGWLLSLIATPGGGSGPTRPE